MNLRIRPLVVTLSILLAPLRAQEAETWQVVDLPFSASESAERPFDVTFGATWLHEDGEVRVVPGFFDGDGRWMLRFAPGRSGRWTFRTFSTLPSLEGKTGELRVADSVKSGRRGPIAIDPKNPRRFVHADGAPYFALSFELDWLFALDWDNPDDIPKTRSIVGHVADNGFNQVVMNVYAYDANWGERERIRPGHNFAKPAVFPYGGTNEQPDHSTLNVAFFRHLDRVLAHLHEKEVVAHLMIYVWNKKVNWAKPYTPEDNLYFDYVVKRFQAFPNIIWDISKEALAYGRDDLGYITDRIARLRRLDGHRRLVTVHDYAYCRQHPDKVDFVSVQEWRPNLYNEMLAVADRHPQRPIVNIEHGGYEMTMHGIFTGAYTDAIACLDRAYLCVFAGTYPTYYWQNSSWYEVVYDPGLLPPGQRPAFHYYRNMAELFARYEFNRLEPRQYLYSPYCLTDNKTVFLYYLPRDMFALEGMAPTELRGKTVRLSWFDPLSGETLLDRDREIANRGGAWTGYRKPALLGAGAVVAILEVVEL